MELTDVALKISKFLEEELLLPYEISFDIIRDAERDGACLRYNATPYATKRYIGGDRDVTYSLGYYFHYQDAEACRNEAQKALDALDGRLIDGVMCEAVTAPQYVETDEKGFAIYSATIHAKIHILEELEL